MSILDGYATSEENDYDAMVENHKNGDCLEYDCPLCEEEDYQRDMWERLEDKRRVIDDAKAKACADAFKPLAINVVKLFKK